MYTLQCLGVGRGATNFLTGEPSTAYALKKGGVPIMLLDCGAGVGISARHYLSGTLPDTIYVSHNHTDHTGDLPLYIATQKGRKISILGHNNILSMLQEHRLHELPSVGVDPFADITWLGTDAEGVVHWGDLQLETFRSRHAYECYGFVMRRGDTPILGWTADSRFDPKIFDTVSAAPIAVLHGRDSPSGDHASFDEIDGYAMSRPETKFFVAHYEKTVFSFSAPNVTLLKTGDEIPLG